MVACQCPNSLRHPERSPIYGGTLTHLTLVFIANGLESALVLRNARAMIERLIIYY